MLAIKRAPEEVLTQNVAADLGRNHTTVQAWINKFRSGGISALFTKSKGNGPQSRLTPEMEKAMIEQLKLGKWRTARDAWQWLSNEKAIHFVIGDGAGFHHKEDDETLPGNIRNITLPACCPELNPAEKLWDIVKDGICNQQWSNLRTLEDAITKRIQPC